MKKDYEFYLIGTGATGSQLLPMLTQLINNTNDKKVTLIDGDVVESKNLKNQKFLEKDIGFYKAEVLAERYTRVYPNLELRYMTNYITDESSFLNILGGDHDKIKVIIACVDNVETRKVICEALSNSKNNNLEYIYIDSGNGTIARNGQIVVQSNINSFNCSKLPWDIFPEIKESTQTVTKALSCGNQTDKNPQNIATNIYSAVNIFMIITNLIMFDTIDKNFIKFDAENIDTVSRLII